MTFFNRFQFSLKGLFNHVRYGFINIFNFVSLAYFERKKQRKSRKEGEICRKMKDYFAVSTFN